MKRRSYFLLSTLFRNLECLKPPFNVSVTKIIYRHLLRISYLIYEVLCFSQSFLCTCIPWLSDAHIHNDIVQHWKIQLVEYGECIKRLILLSLMKLIFLLSHLVSLHVLRGHIQCHCMCYRGTFSVTVSVTEAHLEPCQVCPIEFFPKINGCFYLLNIFVKSSIVDISHHSRQVSVLS